MSLTRCTFGPSSLVGASRGVVGSSSATVWSGAAWPAAEGESGASRRSCEWNAADGVPGMLKGNDPLMARYMVDGRTARRAETKGEAEAWAAAAAASAWLLFSCTRRMCVAEDVAACLVDFSALAAMVCMGE